MRVLLLPAASSLKTEVNPIPCFDLVLESELATLHCISLDTRNSSGFPGSYLLYEAAFLLSSQCIMRDDPSFKIFPLKRAVMLEICSCRLQSHRQEAGRVRETLTTFPPSFADAKATDFVTIMVAQLWSPTRSWTSTLELPVTCSCCLKVPLTAQTFNQLVLTTASLQLTTVVRQQPRSTVLTHKSYWFYSLARGGQGPFLQKGCSCASTQAVKWPPKAHGLPSSLPQPGEFSFKYLQPFIQQKPSRIIIFPA